MTWFETAADTQWSKETSTDSIYIQFPFGGVPYLQTRVSTDKEVDENSSSN